VELSWGVSDDRVRGSDDRGLKTDDRKSHREASLKEKKRKAKKNDF
jgi:hypothetical protein